MACLPAAIDLYNKPPQCTRNKIKKKKRGDQYIPWSIDIRNFPVTIMIISGLNPQHDSNHPVGGTLSQKVFASQKTQVPPHQERRREKKAESRPGGPPPLAYLHHRALNGLALKLPVRRRSTTYYCFAEPTLPDRVRGTRTSTNTRKQIMAWLGGRWDL